MTRLRRALVLGANGQDGSYLVDHLLAAGWDVSGVGRDFTSRREGEPERNYSYIQTDIADQRCTFNLLYDLSPDFVFHVAATHGMSGFVYENVWDQVLQVNTQSVLAILEYLRSNRDCGLCYISSSKVFGSLDGAHINEMSPKHSNCLYTISKNASHDLISYYRKKHAVNASVVWTFNHESPRRGAKYFIPRIARAIVNAETNNLHHETFERLDFWGNWGSAAEYMKILVNLADRNVFDDFILASPHTVWAEHLVQELFAARHLDWKNYIGVKTPSEGLEIPPFSVDLSKLKRLNGNTPIQSARDVTEEIIRSLQQG
jgi:GDPmannose 4,6-dehydratase